MRAQEFADNAKATPASLMEVEMEVMRTPVDLGTVLDGIKRAGMQPFNLPRSTNTGAATSTITNGRLAQLGGSSVVLFLRNGRDATDNTVEKSALCSISEDDYAILVEEADNWMLDFSNSRRIGSGADGAPLPNGTILHLVTANDTIQGLAIKYDTSVARLRELNQLPQGRDLFERRDLIVPVGQSDGRMTPHVSNPSCAEFRDFVRYTSVMDFVKATGCSEDEGWCYMEFNFYDPAKARANFDDDSKWDAGFNDAFARRANSLEQFLAQQNRGSVTKTLSI